MKTSTLIIIPTVLFLTIFSIMVLVFTNDIGEEEIAIEDGSVSKSESDETDSGKINLERILESCSGKFGVPLERETLWLNDTHKITTDSCEIEKRTNSGISMDRTLYHVPDPNMPRTSVGAFSESENRCGKFYIAPTRQHINNTIPVLLMDLDSTGCARLTFTTYRDHTDSYWSPIDDFNSSLFIGSYNYQKEGITSSTSSGKDYTNSFHIDTIPQTADIANFPISSNFTIIHIITPLSNATGFYDQSIPELACKRYPLAVGYSADQVNHSDFSHINLRSNPCVAGTYLLDTVELSGITYKELEIPLNLPN